MENLRRDSAGRHSRSKTSYSKTMSQWPMRKTWYLRPRSVQSLESWIYGPLGSSIRPSSCYAPWFCVKLWWAKTTCCTSLRTLRQASCPSLVPLWLTQDHLRLIRRARDGPGFMIIPSAEDSPSNPSACLTSYLQRSSVYGTCRHRSL